MIKLFATINRKFPLTYTHTYITGSTHGSADML